MTLVVIGTFALGLGATTAVYSVVRGVLLKPLSYPQSERIMRVETVDPVHPSKTNSGVPRRRYLRCSEPRDKAGGMIDSGRFARRIWYLINRRRLERELAQEMEAHRAERGSAGFGNVLLLREESRDVWGWARLDAWLGDLRLAARALARARSFTAAVVVSLALGLTFVASTVAVVNAYLIRPLPYPGADRLYHVMYAPPGPEEPAGISGVDWKALADVVEYPITARSETFYIGEDGYATPARGLRVSSGFLDGLGVRPALGRSFTDADFEPGAEQVALIGDALWRRRFGGDSTIIGGVFRADVENQDDVAPAYRIVGVLPRGFWFGRESTDTADVMVPLRQPIQTYMVRLRPGTAVPLAERRITEGTRQVATTLPRDWTGVHLESMRDRYVAALRPILAGIAFAGALVIAIVCANTAVLTLLRAMRRQHEMGVRTALGASAFHIVRMLAAETLILAGAATAGAIVLTTATLVFLGPAIERRLGRPAPGGAATITVDPLVLVVVTGAGLLIALSLAVLPRFTRWQRGLPSILRSSDRSATDNRTLRRARAILVALQTGGSLVLLVGCMSMVRNVVAMLHADLGFKSDRLIRVATVVPAHAYPDTTSLLAFDQRVAQRVQDLTGSPVAFASWPPYYDVPGRPFEIDGQTANNPVAGSVSVGAGYFSLLSIPMRQGREFTSSDLPGSEPVAIVSESFARKQWPEGGAIGRRIRTIQPGAATIVPQWRTIVGVAADVRQTYADAQLQDVYVPVYQSTPGRYASFYFRSDRTPGALLGPLRETISGTDRSAIVRWAYAVASEDRELAGAKLVMSLLGGIAGFAVVLSLLGISGVMAYAVQQREREIAIRVAIGATRDRVMSLFLVQGGRMIVAGIICGVVTSIGLGQLLASRSAGAWTIDWLTLASAGVFMATVGLLTAWGHSRRAANSDPASILNQE